MDQELAQLHSVYLHLLRKTVFSGQNVDLQYMLELSPRDLASFIPHIKVSSFKKLLLLEQQCREIECQSEKES